MPTNYTPSGSPMPASIPLLKDGEVANEDDLMDDILKPVIDGVGYCQGIIGTGTIVRIFDVDWVPLPGWALDGPSFDWTQYDDPGKGGVMRGRIRALPNGATVTKIRIWIKPAVHVAMPTVTPIIDVYDYVVATVPPVAVGPIATLTDPSMNFTAYNLYHPLVASGLTLAIDTVTKAYYLIITGENDPNAVNGLTTFTRAEVTYHY